MPNDGIRLKIILIIEVRKLEFTDFDSHSLFGHKTPLVEILLFAFFIMRFSPVVFLQIFLVLNRENDDIYLYFFLLQKA